PSSGPSATPGSSQVKPGGSLFSCKGGEKGSRRLLAFNPDRIGGLAVNRVVSDLQGGLVHAQRHDERDDLEDDVSRDRVEDDDERRAVELEQKLVGVAEEQACHVDAGSLLVR